VLSNVGIWDYPHRVAQGAVVPLQLAAGGCDSRVAAPLYRAERGGTGPAGPQVEVPQGGSHRACVILRCLMSEESTTPDPVELLGRAVEAANRRDLDAAASSFAEDATFDGRALGDHFQGRAAIRSFLEDWFGTYEELEFGLEEVRDLGNGVVFAVVVQNGRPAGSAGHLRQREGWVFVWVRGLIARLTISEVDEARAAAERLAQERGR